MTIEQAAAQFLAKKRIAVTGVSRSPRDHGANIVYRRLRERGYQVFAVNPNADQAADYGRRRGINVIAGGCPLMFEPTSDFGHKVMRVVCTFAGRVPKEA